MHFERIVNQETKRAFQHHPTTPYQTEIYAHLVITQQIQSCLNLTHPTHYEFEGISIALLGCCRHNPCICYSMKCPLEELKDA
ncbi:hypothetical protein MtrunA17_Chr3g0108181 [Medicago truncatula]|uniref:Uncharacterized protein n=1 Tax=Medicago truncatula TaxID=3880 RepID=A0A396IQT4_MEDTR|nr:hypothetical protein MtrunA17_Chr3g0108181 [Medicago truncatula]